MADLVTKLIPWIQAFPIWLHYFTAVWIVFTAILLVAFLLTPRSLREADSQVSNPPAPTKEIPPASTTERKIEQKTTGDNSPAIAGVEGDVTVEIKQRKNAN